MWALVTKGAGWLMSKPMLIAGIVFLSFVTYQFFENRHLKEANADFKVEIAAVQKEVADTQQNLTRVDTIQSANAGVRNTQTIIRERIQNVPVASTDRPFVDDPGLLDRIDVMRDHQRAYGSGEQSATDQQEPRPH